MSVAPKRATSVQGIQIQRPELGSVETAPLARTGVNNHVLVAVAVALLVLGNSLIRSTRPRRTL